MDQRVEIRCRGTLCTPILTVCIRHWAAKLMGVCPSVERCDVAIEAQRRAQGSQRFYRVRLRLQVPGEDVVIVKQAATGGASGAFECVHEAFRAARRSLDEQVRRVTPSEHRPLAA